MKIIANEIPQISQAFTCVDNSRQYIFRKNGKAIGHTFAWVKPFDANRDNEWIATVTVEGNTCTICAKGIYTYLNGVCVSSFGLKGAVANILKCDS